VPAAVLPNLRCAAALFLSPYYVLPMNLDAQFKAAVAQVDNLPAEVAAPHMNELYGLYKQATEGDVNMQNDAVDADAADRANGPAGLSQAQWDAWNQYKGVPEQEAKQRYVARVAEVAGSGPAGGPGQPTNDGSADAGSNALSDAPVNPDDNTTLARQPNTGPGVATAGGLRGDITAGAPYGGEDALKGQQ
jgi:acyl-CoA-binding protein